MNRMRLMAFRSTAAFALFVFCMAAAVCSVPNAEAGDLDGVIGYKFKIQEGDGYVPPGDNAPAGSSVAGDPHDGSPRGRFESSAMTLHRDVINFALSWLFRVKWL